MLAVDSAIDLSWRFWLLLLLTGFGAGLAGGLLMHLLHAVQHIAWSYKAGTFLEAVSRSRPIVRVGVVVGAGVLVAAGLLLLQFATGGHAGEISVAIWFRAGRAPVLRTLGRAMMSIVEVGMGAALGREGALKQTGALVGSELAALARLRPAQRRLLTACGVGAGMAAAYNIPLGGALFALEVLIGSISLPLAIPALACAFVATATAWLLLPMSPTYTTPGFELTPQIVGWALVAGPLIGGFAMLYVRVIAWADRGRPKSPLLLAAAPVAAFLALGLAAIPFPQLLGNGLDVVQASLQDRAGPLWLMASLVFMRLAATALCLKSGAPGGLFTPTLTCGALLGGVLGRVWSAAVPAAACDSGACAMIGGGALLAAATEGPASAITSVLELGRHVDLIIAPLIVAAAGSVLVARLTRSPSIYSARVRQAAGHAGARVKPPDSGFRIEPDYLDISAAAHAAAAEHELLEGQTAMRSVHVLDETGKPIGALSPEKMRAAKPEREPMQLMTAGDFVEPLAAVRADAQPKALKHAFARNKGRETPVTDPQSGVMIGVAKPAHKRVPRPRKRSGSPEHAR
jgi:H+/Cl- antiporter ClcA